MRTECLYNNELIYIVDFFTVKDGRQIAIEGEIEKLRSFGRSGKLVCSCGCGGKVILVAGKKMMRRQHFRLKDGQNVMCKSYEESPITMNAKVVLKCWLVDIFALQKGEVLFNIPINRVSELNRKYEYTHLVVNKRIGICYERNESNLNDEKIELLSLQNGITNLCITDIKNNGCWGQYPEFGLKVQKIQGYYALLAVGEMTPYEEAILKIVRYEKTYFGTWFQIDVCEAKLFEYSFDENNKLCLNGNDVYDIALKKSDEYITVQEEQKRLIQERREREKCEEEEKEYWEQCKRLRSENNYREIGFDVNETQKEHTIEDILNNNPKIMRLMEFISELHTLGGKFTYVSKEDRSSTNKYEIINIKDINFNPHRMRIEVTSHNGERYIIYLKLDKKCINTKYTWDGYLIFDLYEIEERDVIFQFRQVMECNGERYEESYMCTLDFECPYKGDVTDICTYTSVNNKCSYRECVRIFKTV